MEGDPVGAVDASVEHTLLPARHLKQLRLQATLAATGVLDQPFDAVEDGALLGGRLLPQAAPEAGVGGVLERHRSIFWRAQPVEQVLAGAEPAQVARPALCLGFALAGLPLPSPEELLVAGEKEWWPLARRGDKRGQAE